MPPSARPRPARPRSRSGRESESAPQPPPECDRLWTIQDVSDFLGVPVTTLHQWRYLGNGPGAFKVGRHLRYDPAVVRRWLVEQCVSERPGA